MRRKEFKVIIDTPDDITGEQMRAYIADAILQWDPLFRSPNTTVVVEIFHE